MSARNQRTLFGIAVLAILVIALAIWRPWSTGPEPAAVQESERSSETTSRRSSPPQRAGRQASQGAANADEPVPVRAATLDPAEDAPRGRFSGRVVNWGNGKPVAGAELSFAGALGVESTTSDASGRFVFEPSDGGDYRLAAVTKDGFLPFAPSIQGSPIHLAPRAKRGVGGLIFYLSPALTYSGRVVDGRGEPVAGADVRMVTGMPGDNALAGIKTEFVSGKDGRFDFHSPDGALFHASHPSAGTGSARVGGAVNITRKMEIKLEPGPLPDQVVSGVVQDENGVAVPDATLRLGSGAARPTTSDEAGRFRFELANKAPWPLEVDHPGFIKLRDRFKSQPLRVVLKRGGRIRGRVIDAGGSPVPAFTVAVLKKHDIGQRPVTDLAVLDASGAFEVRGVEPGEYQVVVMANGFAQSKPVPASAAKDNPPEVSVSLVRGATLVGKVVSADKSPLGNAKVSVESAVALGTSALPMTRTAITRSDGSFELVGITPGRGSVTAAAFKHNRKIVGGLEFRDGEKAGPIEVVLSPTKEGEEPTMEVAGIGVSIGADKVGLRVIKVFEGGGAHSAGIVNGELIVAVEGKAVLDLGFQGALQQIRGPVNTTVRLTVRDGQGDDRNLAVTRKKITVPG